MNKRWIIESANEQEIAHLQQVLRINPTLCKLLVQRGIKTFDEAKSFFRPSLDYLLDPFFDEGHGLSREQDRYRHAESREKSSFMATTMWMAPLR